MDNFIRKIIDIEHEAQSIISRAEKAKQSMTGELEAELSAIEKEFEQKNSKIICDEKERLDMLSQQRLEKLKNDYNTRLDALNKSFSDSKSWQDCIFNEIVGEVI